VIANDASRETPRKTGNAAAWEKKKKYNKSFKKRIEFSFLQKNYSATCSQQ